MPFLLKTIQFELHKTNQRNKMKEIINPKIFYKRLAIS